MALSQFLFRNETSVDFKNSFWLKNFRLQQRSAFERSTRERISSLTGHIIYVNCSFQRQSNVDYTRWTRRVTHKCGGDHLHDTQHAFLLITQRCI